MLDLLAQPQAWAAFAALVTMEIILGIDNLIFISIVSGKLPERQAKIARQVGLSLALILRLALLSVIAWIVGLTAPVIDLGIQGAPGEHGEPSFETAFSWRDLILIAGGVFLCVKSTQEIHHKVSPGDHADGGGKAAASLGVAIAQIIALDAVFSVDSILTAIGMTDELPIMVAAVIVAVGVMFAAAGAVTRFVNANPSVVMLALAFLLMIGMVLIADGFGRHVPKGYIYSAMAFAVLVEVLNMFARRRRHARQPAAAHE
ncbi:Membrane protein TerC, possibly involved in tellurium resistance [Palleronia marisminoris]|uniref:Integral membrane protein TerC family protein n=1 Tax=Palleronia marisminoris TaxID=315423 RepID=A0A1Y5T4L9_9RHOB|nr:TerC family protein [Palleronia marisminoris]SFH15887.1 Membrane protein TerC, possibly involved in tellurium resistance [Palleronia marisminoris]SLN55133.1 Integral membrane protein TerC family protein [Palleronia marisminoris]